MNGDDSRRNVKDLINAYNTKDHVILPKPLPKKVAFIQHRESSPSSSESESYDLVDDPPKIIKRFEHVLKNDDTSSDDEDVSGVDHHFNVPEIILETKTFLKEEEVYTQLLTDLVENYVRSIETDRFEDVFGRIEIIWRFQTITFLPALKSSRNMEEIAACFVKYKTFFSNDYDYFFKNQPKMNFVMYENKETFKVNKFDKQFLKWENILQRTLNERIFAYMGFLDSMKNILETEVAVTYFERAISILTNLTKLFFKEEEKVRYVISEIVESERLYIEKLQNIIKHVVPEIHKKMPNRMHNAIIGNVAVIAKNQQAFYKDMEMCLITFDATEIGNCFLQHKPCFMQYIKDQQMKNDPDAIEQLQSEQSSFWREFNFHTPLERLYKYKLLLDALDRVSNKSCYKVQEAYKMVMEIISKINIVAAINCIRDENLYLNEQGDLILRDEFSAKYKGNKFNAMVFLFEKSIIFTEAKIETYLGNTRDVYIYWDHIVTKRLSATHKDNSSSSFLVGFYGQNKTVVYELKAKDANTREIWIAALREQQTKQILSKN